MSIRRELSVSEEVCVAYYDVHLVRNCLQRKRNSNGKRKFLVLGDGIVCNLTTCTSLECRTFEGQAKSGCALGSPLCLANDDFHLFFRIFASLKCARKDYCMVVTPPCVSSATSPQMIIILSCRAHRLSESNWMRRKKLNPGRNVVR